ncbi:MAG: hypothetical protein ACE37H_14290 [Phycisphaeraceae bacterium]
MPHNSDLIYAEQFEALIQAIVKYPSMYANGGSYEAVTSYISGMDSHCHVLVGLYQWLVVQLNGYDNVVWWASLIELSEVPISCPLETEQDHQHAIRFMGQKLTEFFDYRREVGLTTIFVDYAKWLNRHN